MTTIRGKWTYRLRSREPTAAINCMGRDGKPATWTLEHDSTWGFELSKDAPVVDGFYCDDHAEPAMKDAEREFYRSWKGDK